MARLILRDLVLDNPLDLDFDLERDLERERLRDGIYIYPPQKKNISFPKENELFPNAIRGMPPHFIALLNIVHCPKYRKTRQWHIRPIFV